MRFHRFITDSSSSRLLLIFAGWGMDEKPFAGINPHGYDVAVVWDYRSLQADFIPELMDYDEILIAAWSFGVAAASQFILDHPELPVTSRVAINGTQHPVDDRLGIPKAIFQGTLEGLTSRTLSKFHLRMAGSSQRYQQFSANLPTREITELRDELTAIGQRNVPLITWDRAYIADNDRIIPTANHQKAWEAEACSVHTFSGAHLPDFGTLFHTMFTDKCLVSRRFGKASMTYDSNASVQQLIARTLTNDWAPACTSPVDVLEIGCGTGYATRLLMQKLPIRTLTLWDLHVPSGLHNAINDRRSSAISIKECDAETEIRALEAETLDVIFSTSTVQWFNSLPAFLRTASRVLRPGGQMVISTFGPRTMEEVNHAIGRKSPYPDLPELRRMLPAAFRIDMLSSHTEVLSFSTPMDVLRHIRDTGVNALSAGTTVAQTHSILKNYPTSPSGDVTLTYQPIYIILTKTES